MLVRLHEQGRKIGGTNVHVGGLSVGYVSAGTGPFVGCFEVPVWAIEWNDDGFERACGCEGPVVRDWGNDGRLFCRRRP